MDGRYHIRVFFITRVLLDIYDKSGSADKFNAESPSGGYDYDSDSDLEDCDAPEDTPDAEITRQKVTDVRIEGTVTSRATISMP